MHDRVEIVFAMIHSFCDLIDLNPNQNTAIYQPF
jgi:hypothetical protein